LRDPAMPGARRPDRCRRRVHEGAAEPTFARRLTANALAW
jgi:hypothetical protein